MGIATRRINRSILASSIAAAFLLSGCGGGGGSSASPTNSSSGSQSVSGIASKGIIRHGLVIAEELDINGTPREVGTAETDENGSYNLDLDSSYGGGVVRLTIIPKADGSTKMVCDVRPNCDGIPFGQEIDLTVGGFEMQAVVPPVNDGAAVTAQITPYTHMAAARLKGQSYTAAAVANANSEVSQIVGVPILETPPLDITDLTAVASASSEAQQYAAFNAGMGEQLFANAGGIEGGLDDLASTFADGVFDADDEIDISALATAVRNQAAVSGISSETIAQTVAVIESSISGGSYDPEPTNSAALPAITQAKALVAEVRTLVTSIEALENPADAFGMDLETASTVIDNNSIALFEMTGMVIQSVFDAIDSGALEMGATADVSVLDRLGVSVGAVSATLGNNNGLTLTISSTDLGGVTVALNMASNIPASSMDSAVDITGLDFTLTGSVENSEARIALENIDFSTTLAEAIQYDGITGVVTEPVAGIWPTSLAFSGALTVNDKINIMSFSGTADITMLAFNQAGSENRVGLEEILLNGTFAGNGDSFEADIGFTVNNAASFDTIGFLQYESYLSVYEWAAGDTFGAQGAAASLGITTLSSAYFDEWSGETCFHGRTPASLWLSVCESGDSLGVSQAIGDLYPGALGIDYINYQYSSWAGGTWYWGEVQFADFETAGNFADVTLTATLNLVLANHPSTTAVATVNRTALEGGNALVTLTHDGQSINVSTEVNGSAATVTVSNADGVSMVLTGLNTDAVAISGTVTVGNTEVGTISETSTGIVILRYSDGSMESLQ